MNLLPESLKSKTIRYYGLSFQGRRQENQDSFLILPLGDDGFFFCIADGMGGNQGGRVASQIVTETIRSELQVIFKRAIKVNELKDVLERIYHFAQLSIKQKVQVNPELLGMGTTLICLLLYQGKYVFANIGDSRLYKIKGKRIIQSSIDHSAIEEMRIKHNGTLPDEFVNRYSHIITRCIDGGDDEPDIYPIDENAYDLKPGLSFLLCSDGLFNKNEEFDHGMIKSIFTPIPAEQIVKWLISYAYSKGSTDNITAIFIDTRKPRKRSYLANLTYPPVDGS